MNKTMICIFLALMMLLLSPLANKCLEADEETIVVEETPMIITNAKVPDYNTGRVWYQLEHDK